MTRGGGWTLGVLAALLAGAAGYWYGGHGREPAQAGPAQAGAPKPARKLLYYRNPMGLPDTSPVPKKDPMGMDYVAVYEGEDADEAGAAGAPQLRVSTEKVQKLGVRTEAASMRALALTVRAVGRVEPDERLVTAITPKFEGYVERLLVNTTGQPVGKGQPLFEVYSPELVSAQREYALAMQGMAALNQAGTPAQDGMRQLAEASLARLRNWDISEEQIRALAQSGQARRTLLLRSPVAGIVTQKKAVQGMRFMPGEALYQVSDLSRVWVVADVAEQDLGLLKSGAKARVAINAYPGQSFDGAVTYVYPTLDSATRTVPVRIELANPGRRLKPGMYAQVELAAGAAQAVLTVPLSAVIDSGKRQIVLVQSAPGRFEPREVQLGARSDERVAVLAGVRAGEPVVVAANFLLDAESNLKAALSGLGQTASDNGGKPAAGVGHKASGTVESVDAKEGTVSISHGPVASLKWPAMTMDFKPANAAVAQQLKPGAAIAFEFVERAPGEWVITSVTPEAADTHGKH